MKKFFLTALLIIVVFKFFAQSQESKNIYGKITYEQVQKNPELIVLNSYLYINREQSIYKWNPNNFGITNENDGTTIQHSNKKKTDFFYMYNKPIEKTLITRLFIDDKEYLIKEDSLNIRWKILNEFKKINTYHCQKAETLFRGRKYFAWFTSEIPIPFGPNKFSGLDGLILELFEENYLVSFSVKKIIINDPIIKKEVENAFKIKLNLNKTITPKKYNIIVLNHTLELEKMINSRRSKGKKPFKFKHDCDDCSKKIEIRDND